MLCMLHNYWSVLHSMHWATSPFKRRICEVQASNQEKEALLKEVADLKDELFKTEEQAALLSENLHKVSGVRQQGCFMSWA